MMGVILWKNSNAQINEHGCYELSVDSMVTLCKKSKQIVMLGFRMLICSKVDSQLNQILNVHATTIPSSCGYGLNSYQHPTLFWTLDGQKGYKCLT